MKIILILLLFFSIPSFACSKKEIPPLIYAEKWQMGGDDGVTIFTQKTYRSRVVSSVMLHIEFSNESKLTALIDTSQRVNVESPKIDSSEFNASYIYLTDDILEKSRVIVTYDFQYEEGAVISACSSISNNYSLKELLGKT